MTQLWDIQKFVDQNGKCLFDEWRDNLTPMDRARVDARLRRIKVGNFGDHKTLGKGLYELRLFVGPGIRVYYGSVASQVVLLLVGGTKKSQAKDIQRAKSLWKQYKQETEN